MSRPRFWLIGLMLLLAGAVAAAQTPSTYEIVDAFHGGTLIQAADGNFYGTTQWTVFRRTPSGEVTVLHTFTGPDGAGPSQLLQAANGDFYGATFSGGAHDAGTVYRIKSDGSFQTLHEFDVADGSGPSPLVQASDGNFYGVTAGGGVLGFGTIFRIDSAGEFASIGSFDRDLNAATPNGPLVEAGGLLCGTTQEGGADPSVGTVFCASFDGLITTDHSFSGTDGAVPLAGLINNDGQLFGTTWGGGSGDQGTIFLTGAGSFDVDTWHNFGGPEGGNPAGPLALGDAIRGTTGVGGAFGFGTIFRLNFDHTVDVLHDFTGIGGRGPSASLFQAADGFLYGTAGGGPYGMGVVFRMTNAQVAVNQVSPASGPAEGGAAVDVIGGGFVPGVTVTIGGIDATDVTVVDPTFLHLLTPALSPGTYDVKVTAPGGASATLAAAFVVNAAGPTIASFTPPAGPINVKVTINGTGFTGVSSVKFNGKAASFNVLSGTQLTANVSGGTTSGKITVTTAAGTATSATDFIVAVPPTVTGFTPGSGVVGTAVVIAGSHFDTASAVAFNGFGATFTINSPIEIIATVPALATTGKIKVTNAAGGAYSAAAFLVTPTITSFSPASGLAGTTVTINGQTFNNASSVQFNGLAAAFTLNSSTKIIATVPSGATSGKIAVTTPGGTATSATNFMVLPTITSFTPAAGPFGVKVTINGTGLTGTTSVKFNGKAASFHVLSANQLTANVSTGTTSGRIKVTTPAGTATSASDFIVAFPPTITGFTPGSGLRGTPVVVTGTNFGTATAVAFNTASTTVFTINSPTKITVNVPSAATTGKIKVINAAGAAYSVDSFLVLTALPAVDGSIRDFPADGTPDVVIADVSVEVLATSGGPGAPPMEERGILEFSLAGVPPPVVGANLVLPVRASGGLFPSRIDVYGYAGDGLIKLGDWARGSLVGSFDYSGEQTVTVDITSFLSTAIANGYAFAGFNLRFSVPSPIPPNGAFVAFGSLELPPAAALVVQ